jgi:hypothetical protein
MVNRQVTEPLSQLDQYLIKAYSGALRKAQAPIRYNRFGTIAEDSIAAITLHTRMATSAKDFMNTHPFVDGDTSLIHNGVIRNADRIGLKQSTCDSEAILNLYVKHKVNQKPDAIELVARRLQGYYACGVLTRNKSDGALLDVFKCSQARLSAAFIQELNTVVFSTAIADIKSACQRLNFNVMSEFGFEDQTMLRLDALTGEVIETLSFKVPAQVYESPVYKRDVQVPKRKSKVSKTKDSERVTKIREWQEQIPEGREWLYQGDWWKKGDE